MASKTKTKKKTKKNKKNNKNNKPIYDDDTPEGMIERGLDNNTSRELTKSALEIETRNFNRELIIKNMLLKYPIAVKFITGEIGIYKKYEDLPTYIFMSNHQGTNIIRYKIDKIVDRFGEI